MPKTKEELNELKIEYELLKTKLVELTEEELYQVTGGNDREKSIMVKVVISDCGPFVGDVSITPYLDGVLLSSQVKKVDESCEYVNILTRGIGLALLAVKINNTSVKNYTINFDKGTYSQT